ncbi:MAG: GNAT family protein [Eubacteriales bacterium]|nr:GNAT family protein [Eubacteriales bacterium]
MNNQRISIRPYCEKDCQDLLPSFSSWNEMKYLLIEDYRIYDEESLAKDLSKWIEAGSQLYSVISNASQKVIGLLTLDDLDQRNRNCYLGICIVPAAQGQGLASESIEIFCNFLFDQMGLEMIVANTIEGNEASAKLMERCKFRFVGRLERAVIRDGKFLALNYYQRFREEPL